MRKVSDRVRTLHEEPRLLAVKINRRRNEIYLYILSELLLFPRADDVFDYVQEASAAPDLSGRSCVSGQQIPRMSGQCGASRTSVTLYHRRTSKYGTAGDQHTQSRFND